MRSIGVEEPNFVGPTHGGGLSDQVLRFMENEWGMANDLALTEIVPVSFPQISLHVIVPNWRRSSLVLFSTGMADEAMNVPSGFDEYRLA